MRFSFLTTICASILILASCRDNHNAAVNTVTSSADTVVQQTDTVPGNVAAKDTTAPSLSMLIIPGRSLGKTMLGENMDSVLQQLGKPDNQDAAMGKAMYIWYRGHNKNSYETDIYASRKMGVDETSRVRQIRVTSPDFKTAAGLHVGSSLTEIQFAYKLNKTATYTKSGKHFTIYDTGNGIGFETSQDSTCVAVIVLEAGSTINAAYLSFQNDVVQDN